MAGLRRQLLSIGEDEEEEPMFKVKKTRLSRKMAATKAPADLPFKKAKEKTEAKKDPRLSRLSRAEPEPLEVEEVEEVEDVEEVAEPREGFDMEPEEPSALQAARLARAQRQAARDGSKPPGSDSRERIKALAAAAQRELNDGEEEEPEDVAEAWALRQLEVGLHRRRGQAPPEELDLEQELAELEKPRRSRDGVSQVQKAAERVAKGHDGQQAVQKEQSAFLAPGEAMAKLWDTMKTLEGSAENREAKLEELTSQAQAAQDELREIERQDKQVERSLRVVRELEEIAWSLGGLLDEKSAKCKQATTMLSKIEENFVKRRSRRRAKQLREALLAAGATVHETEDASDEELPPRKAAARSHEGWETSDASDDDGLQQTRADRRSFCAAVHRQLFEDVAEDFGSTAAVLKVLKSAKQKLQEEYRQAFVHLSLPEVFGFFVEHSTFWWDPFGLAAADDAHWGPKKPLFTTQLESFDWFEDLAAYTELMGDDDPDGELVPKVVQKCIFPEVARRLRHCWDITSREQTKHAVALLDECLLFEVGEGGAFNELLLAALDRLRLGIKIFAPDLFVPAPAVSSWYASPVRKRWLWRCCKIANCAAQLEGRVADEHLAPLILNEIFATRIAPHLQGPRLHAEEMDLVEHFVAALPERWLEPLPAALSPLRDCLGPRCPRNAEATQVRAQKLLVRLKCFDEAEALQL